MKVFPAVIAIRAIGAISAIALLSACSHATNDGVTSTGAPSNGPAALNYLSKDAIEVETALPAPPIPESSQDLSELQEILGFQSSRTQADCDRANREVIPDLAHFFRAPDGPLTADEISRWNPLFERVAGDVQYFVIREKEFWKRPRPAVENPGIHPCVPLGVSLGVPLENDGSYPSGHATEARAFADILSTLNPSEKSALMNREAQIANDQVIAGVHHSSDVVAGEELGDAIFQALLQSAPFEQDLNALSR